MNNSLAKTMMLACLLSLGLFACGGGGSGSSPARFTDAVDEDSELPDTSELVRDCQELLVEMSDGVRLHAWVSTLFPEERRPILFEFETYAQHDNGCPPFAPGEYIPNFMSQAVIDQFTIVHFSYRGTGASEGEFDLSGPRTQADIREAIAWAAAQDFSNGDVVLTGQSGTAFGAHFGLREPAVKAAVLFTSCADMYRCVRRGGVYNGLGEVYMARTQGSHASAADDRQRLGTDSNPNSGQQTAALTDMQNRLAENSEFTDFWAERSALATLDQVDIPVLYTSDVFDIVQSFDAVQQTPDARFIFAMGHTTEEPIANSDGLHAELVRNRVDRFVRHYGLGENNGAQNDPRLLTMAATGGVRGFRGAQALVREDSAWPIPGTRWTKLFISDSSSGSADSLNDGSLLAEAPAASGSTLINVSAAQAAEGDLRTASWLSGAIIAESNNRERSGLTWTTPELAMDTEINGPIVFNVYATANATDFDWVLRLTDVWPDGVSHWITDGYLRASLRAVDETKSLKNSAGEIVRPWYSFTGRSAPPAGEMQLYQVEIIPTANIFRAGHRIRLDFFPVAASSSDRNASGSGLLEIHHGGDTDSHLILPLIPARCHLSTPLASIEPAITACAANWAEAIGAAP